MQTNKHTSKLKFIVEIILLFQGSILLCALHVQYVHVGFYIKWTICPLYSILIEGRLENVFLLCGTDRRIHVYRKTVNVEEV